MKNLHKKIIAMSIIFLIACSVKQNEVVITKNQITPPIEGLENKFKTYTVSNEKGGEFITSTGSKIFIPKNAFSDKNGELIAGNVDVKFREYHNSIDLFLSGIPMEYDAEGTKENFETAGMFEIQGNQNGEQVVINSNKKIKVVLASFQKDDDYRFFELQENKNDWTYTGENEPLINTSKEIKIDSLNKLKNYPSIPLTDNYIVLDHMALADVYFKNDYTSLMDVKRNSFIKKFEEYGLGYLNTYNNTRINFNGVEYPAGMMVWENIGKKFHKNHLNGKQLNCRISYISKHKYKLELFEPKKSKKAVFETVLLAYMPVRSLIAFPAKEWETNRNELLSKIKIEEDRLKLEADCFRTFEVNNFGIYNWDRFQKQELAIQVNGDFRFDTPIDKLNDIVIYCITGNDNSITKVRFKNELIIAPSNSAKLFAILPGNELALFDNIQYQKIDFENLHNTRGKTVIFSFKNKGKITSRNILEKILKEEVPA
jgi:hypothetical protein